MKQRNRTSHVDSSSSLVCSILVGSIAALHWLFDPFKFVQDEMREIEKTADCKDKDRGCFYSQIVNVILILIYFNLKAILF